MTMTNDSVASVPERYVTKADVAADCAMSIRWDAVAQRVLEVLDQRTAPSGPPMLTVAQVAQCYQVRTNWAYAERVA